MDVNSNKLLDRDATEFRASEMREGKLFESSMILPGYQLKMHSKEVISAQLFANLKEVSTEELQRRRDYIKSAIESVFS